MKYAIIILAAMAMASCGDATPDANARETAIRDAGYPSCADTFAIEAAKKLGLE